ncbi:hypothetical protein WJX84_002307 [Apatococcus fuscideae]|uniref:Adaptor protein ClpS core domain-containing protein n=1 Tax=Apatococcus fuscideae TaxID=2026836 RepID=A0AAW1T8Q5_9CHLO
MALVQGRACCCASLIVARKVVRTASYLNPLVHTERSRSRRRPHHITSGHTLGQAVADPDEGGGTSTIDRPDLLRENRGTINLTEAGFGGTEQKPDKKLGGGNYRVILLDDPKHTEELVVQAITTVLPGTEVNHAKNCFVTSRKLGAAIIISCLKEHAEFYGEQIFKMGCRTKIEPDTATI